MGRMDKYAQRGIRKTKEKVWIMKVKEKVS